MTDIEGDAFQSFWSFSLEIYQQEAVKKNCLILQDQYGYNVNFILMAIWAAYWGQNLSRHHLRLYQSELSTLDSKIIIPLRKARRAAGIVFDLDFEESIPNNLSLKEKILSVEIEAEKIFQYRLETLVLRDFPELLARTKAIDIYSPDKDKFLTIAMENLIQYSAFTVKKIDFELKSTFQCLLNNIRFEGSSE